MLDRHVLRWKLFPNQARRWPNRSLRDRYHYWTVSYPTTRIKRTIMWIEEELLYRLRHPFKGRPELRASVGRGPCRHCGKRTLLRRGYVDPQTLQRKIGYECEACSGKDATAEVEARDKRRRLDWHKITTPIRANAIVPESMGEQYPGRVREALRAFEASGAEIATVPGIDPGSLNSSIAALALDGEMYAEQRGQETILRRVNGVIAE